MPRPVIMCSYDWGALTQHSVAGRVAAQRLARASARKQPPPMQQQEMPVQGTVSEQRVPTESTATRDSSVVASAEEADVRHQLMLAFNSAAELAPLAKLPISRSNADGMQCSWQALGGAALEPLLTFTTLIDVRWLLAFARGEVLSQRAGVVPAWQHVPSEAEVRLEDLRGSTWPDGLPVAVLSYGWSAEDHPDGEGRQLQALIPLLAAIVARCDALEAETGVHMSWGVLWDFLSLPQRGHTNGATVGEDRTAAQQARFHLAREHIHVWYAAEHTHTISLPSDTSAPNKTPLDRRGWVVFERQLMSIAKANQCCLDLSQLDEAAAASDGDSRECEWDAIREVCTRSVKSAPLSPAAFEELLTGGLQRERLEPGSGLRLSVPSDEQVLVTLYAKGFLERICVADVLDFGERGWDDAQLRILTAALEYAHEHGATARLGELRLGHNSLTDDGFRALADLLSRGVMAGLKELDLDYNDASHDGRRLVKAASKSRGLACHA